MVRGAATNTNPKTEYSLSIFAWQTALAHFVFSILAGSAGSEREFSRMGYLLSSRRTSYTPSNSNKRLTLANLLPQKRRLEEIMNARGLKKMKLFDAK